MTHTNRLAARLAGLLLLCGGVAQAHHSQALFDMTQCRQLTGIVRTLQFQYPHSWLWVYEGDGSDKNQVWAFEFAAPGNLVQADPRWSNKVVRAGDKVQIAYSPMKDGRKAGSMAALTLPSGDTLKIGTPACAYKYSPGRAAAQAPTAKTDPPNK
jgi:hypothetical protein